ncbi:hypothetical protein NOR_00085 [Metarhizium rileyi]|uniref:Uncharacterized protein n=1 Tax=Metarhizium rileyi (strain RCEF 4871) TaxID=1649241 RepID=A0A167KBK3_METRR|nr:hypothetical protein NOR_00085 [Metarhizium rileyi RCEF 4871]
MLANMVYPADHRIVARSKHKAIEKSSKSQQRLIQSQPVDAEDLTRRLFVVLAEQKAHSERKRQTRAETERLAISLLAPKQKKSTDATPSTMKHGDKLDSSSRSTSETKSSQRVDASQKNKRNRPCSLKPNSSEKKGAEEKHPLSPSYHHVPQVAASQFALTTTVETPAEKGPVHKLSKVAMKFHLEGVNGSRELRTGNPAAPPCEQTKALRRAQSMREKQYERNQFGGLLPPTFEVDDMSCSLSNRDSFHAHSRSREDQGRGHDAERRRSTGSILGQTEAPPIDILELAGALFSPTYHVAPKAPGEHRVDWTQSDEATVAKIIHIAQQPEPKLRKSESRWTLRGRLGSFGRHSRNDKPPSPTDEKSPQDLSPKSPIGSFFLRLKR